MARPGTRSSALLAQASQHLWLAFCYDVYRWVGRERGPFLGLFSRPPSEPDWILVASSGSPVSLFLYLWLIVMNVIMTSFAERNALAFARDHDFHPERHLPLSFLVQVSKVSNVVHLYVRLTSTYFARVLEESFDYF